MNTRIEYRYRTPRSRENIRLTEVVSGIATPQQVIRFRTALPGGDLMIASQLGLGAHFPPMEEITPEDTCWHQVQSIQKTEEEPTVPFSFAELVERAERATDRGWHIFDLYQTSRVESRLAVPA